MTYLRKGTVSALSVVLAVLMMCPTDTYAEQHALVLKVEGMIDPGTEEYIVEAVSEADRLGAQFVLIELNTPGGMLDSTRKIVQSLLNSPTPVIVYVAPSGAHAGSAGLFITMAAHVAAMAPGTNIGAATPISSGGQDVQEKGGEDLAKKVKQDTLAFVRSIAKTRDRNMEWAESAITEAASITSDEALSLGVIDVVSPSRGALLEQLHGRTVTGVADEEIMLQTRGVVLREVELTARQEVIHLLANPNVAYVLMMIGMVGLYFELSNPGAIFPGVAGAIALLMAFASLNVLPFNTTGLLLIILSMGLFVAEVFVPSLGLLSVGGIVAFFLGSLMLFSTPELTVGLSTVMVFGMTALLGLCAAFIGWLVVSTQRAKPYSGEEGMVGEIGQALTDLAPEGRVFVHGENWSASIVKTTESAADSAPTRIEKGQKVRVCEVIGLHLIVEPITEES